MTIPLTGTSGFFTRLGLLGGLLNRINTDRGSTATGVPAKITTLEAQYPNTNHPELLDSINSQLAAWQQGSLGFLTQLQQIAQQTLITMANDDNKLSSKDVPTAMGILISQMKGASQTVNQPTVSVTVTAGGSNQGDAQVVATVKGKDGNQLDYVFSEGGSGTTPGIIATCTTDSQTISGLLGKEPFSVLGEVAQFNELDFSWPLGSATALTLFAISANDQSIPSTNMLKNGNFETFAVANTPDGWVILAGVAGTNIFKSSSPYAGSFALQFTGSGGAAASIAQPFGDSVNGTSTSVAPQTLYNFNCWIKVSSVPAAGVLAIELVDGSNAVINDDAGNANAVTKTLSGATTGYLPLKGTLRTPSILPSAVKLRVRLSTDIDSGKSVFVDHLSFTPGQQLYSGGPFLSIHSGAAKTIKGDTYTIAVSNNYGGAFQLVTERFFSMRQLGLALPSSGSPSISDALVT